MMGIGASLYLIATNLAETAYLKWHSSVAVSCVNPPTTKRPYGVVVTAAVTPDRFARAAITVPG